MKVACGRAVEWTGLWTAEEGGMDLVLPVLAEAPARKVRRQLASSGEDSKSAESVSRWRRVDAVDERDSCRRGSPLLSPAAAADDLSLTCTCCPERPLRADL